MVPQKRLSYCFGVYVLRRIRVSGRFTGEIYRRPWRQGSPGVCAYLRVARESARARSDTSPNGKYGQTYDHFSGLAKFAGAGPAAPLRTVRASTAVPRNSQGWRHCFPFSLSEVGRARRFQRCQPWIPRRLATRTAAIPMPSGPNNAGSGVWVAPVMSMAFGS